ncbi:MAG: hypothetical protein H8E37_08605, partial [Planctomycetes bacterium]|nr:hypothetical protein [Planctomycetota bacterium]
MSEKAARRSSLTLLEVGIILLIAVGLGAYVMQRAKEARRRAVAGVLKSAGAKIIYGKDKTVRAIDMTAMAEEQIRLKDIGLLTKLSAVNLDHSETIDEHLLELSHLERLTKLHLVGTAVTDEGCRHLADHRSMRFLDLRANCISDEGLAELSQLTELVELRLAQTWITDGGLKSLARMQKLETLDLRHSDITDEGLRHLHSLKNLIKVRLIHSRVTAQGVARLQNAMPDLTVEHWPEVPDPNHLRVRLRPPNYSTERDEISRVHVSERPIVQELIDLEKQIPDGPSPPDQDVRDINYLERGGFLYYLELSTEKPPVDLFSRVHNLRNLEDLTLRDFPPTDDFFEDIHRLRFLRRLTIHCPLTNDHLRQIARLPNLAALDVRGSLRRPSRCPDVGLRHLSKLSGLTHLEIANA